MANTSQYLYRDYLLERIAREMPGNPMLYGYGIYSQNEEDGIIWHILSKIQTMAQLSRTFIEFGCGNGLENNTHALVLRGFRGCWIDGGQANIDFICNELGGMEFRNLRIFGERVTLDNIQDILAACLRFLGQSDLDLLSMDLDGNDWHFMKSLLTTARPKVIVAEINPIFAPPMDVVMPYDSSHVWTGQDYYGCSIQAYVNLLRDYTLEAMGLSGFNVFFVRNDLAGIFPLYPVEKLYMRTPGDFALFYKRDKPTLKWLKAALQSPIRGGGSLLKRQRKEDRAEHVCGLAA